MTSPIEATLILCDAATVDPSQKVHMLGAGWSVTSSPTAPSAVVALVKIPWDRTDEAIPTTLRLVDADGHAVMVNDEAIAGPQQNVEVGRPPGMTEGSDVDWAFQVSVPPLPLPPGRYTWTLDMAECHFATTFEARGPAPAA